MPRFNARGQVAKGYGLEWYDTPRTIAQNCDGGHCRIELSDGTLMRDIACNGISAGECAFWAAWVILPSGGPGVLDQDNRMWPLSGLGPMGPDGALALKVLRNSYGPWQVVERDGSTWPLTSGDASAIQLVGPRAALWVEQGMLRPTVGLQFAHPPIGGPGTWGRPRAVLLTGRWMLLYQSYHYGCLVFDGRVLVTGVAFFRPDVMGAGDGILVTWATDEGEGRVEVEHWTWAELAALPMVGALTPPHPEPPMVTPEVTVDLFAFTPNNHLADGEWLQFHDRENAQGAKVRVWVERGSMRMSIEYPGIGVGQTGARRPVR